MIRSLSPSRLGFAVGLAGLVVASVILLDPAPHSAGRPVAAQAGCVSLPIVNGGFEQPDVGKFLTIDQELVPGWSTTASDGEIEIWQSGFQGVPAAEGEQFAELAANEPSRLFQDLPTTPGRTLFYRLFHRGRKGVDTMEVDIGAPGRLPDATRQISTPNTVWQQVVGRYTVPPGQTTTRFGFRAVANASGNPTEGNFIDGVVIAEADCAAVVLQKALVPKTDGGRFDLLVDGAPVREAAGDGAVAGPVVVRAGPVTVAERGAGATQDSDYVSAIRCRSGGGEGPVVASTVGQQVSFSTDPSDVVTCVLLNVHRHRILALRHRRRAHGLDLLTTATAVRPRVRIGSTARFRVRVTNRGPLEATDLRIVPFLRRPGSTVRSLSFLRPRGGGPCVSAARLGACQIGRLAVGGSVEVELSVKATHAGKIPLTAIAKAAQLERRLANNLARATVRVLPPAKGPPGPRPRPPGVTG